MSPQEEPTVYDLVGGLDTMRRLVDAFYVGVEADPVLRPLYPPHLDDSKEHLALFLAQYWGGPRTYSQQRGHPRLRMRHVPFVIGQRERDAWVTHMLAAVDAVGIEDPARQEMRNYFRDGATFLMNAEPNVQQP